MLALACVTRLEMLVVAVPRLASKVVIRPLAQIWYAPTLALIVCTDATVASVALGATVIEKHFTLNRADGGVDSSFSMEPHEMIQLVLETERAWQALGKVSYGPTDAEQKSIVFRRSLYVVKDLKAGDLLSEDNVRAIRPGLGLPTKYFEKVMGKTVKHAVARGTALNWDML